MVLQDVVGQGRMFGQRMDCQEAVRRGRWRSGAGGSLRQMEPLSHDVVEEVCRQQYFARRDPDDGLALGRVLLERRELRGAAAVGQGLLLTRARAEALALLGEVAVRERSFDEAARDFEMAGELYERQERWAEAAATWRRQAELLRMLGRTGEAGAAEAAARRGASEAGKGSPASNAAAATEEAEAGMVMGAGGGTRMGMPAAVE